jgi:hypothetical protein
MPPRKPLRGARLRLLALVVGVAVFVAHVLTIRPGTGGVYWFNINLRDLAIHFAMLLSFTIAYRLSFPRGMGGAGRMTAFVACGWGAACELFQLTLPSRSFELPDLLVNTLTPLLAIWLVGALRWR